MTKWQRTQLCDSTEYDSTNDPSIRCQHLHAPGKEELHKRSDDRLREALAKTQVCKNEVTVSHRYRWVYRVDGHSG